MTKKDDKEEELTEGQPVCDKCGNILVEEDGELVCPKCDVEINFLGDTDDRLD